MNGVDIYENVRDSAAYDVFIPFTVSNENYVHWYNTELSDAVVDGGILINFFRVKHSPKVSGIMLIKGTLQDTDYYEQDKRIKNNKQLLQNKKDLEEKEVNARFEKDLPIIKGQVFKGSDVISTYPVTIVLCTILFFLILQKVLPKAQ